MFAESPRRKKPSPFDGGQVGKPLQVWEIGGCVPTWSKNRVSPRFPLRYLLADKMDWTEAKKRRRSKIPSFKSRRRFFFFLPESLCQIGLGSFPSFRAFLLHDISQGKSREKRGCEWRGRLFWFEIWPSYSPSSSGGSFAGKNDGIFTCRIWESRALLWSRIFRPVLFLPIKDLFLWKRALKVKWKTLQTLERDKDGLNPGWKRKEERRRRRNGAHGLPNPPASSVSEEKVKRYLGNFWEKLFFPPKNSKQVNWIRKKFVVGQTTLFPHIVTPKSHPCKKKTSSCLRFMRPPPSPPFFALSTFPLPSFDLTYEGRWHRAIHSKEEEDAREEEGTSKQEHIKFWYKRFYGAFGRLFNAISSTKSV